MQVLYGGRHDATESNPIRPNQAGRTRIKAQAVRSKLARTSLDFGRARWRRGSYDWMNAKAKRLSEHDVSLISCMTLWFPGIVYRW
jgi:hypothetical protein